MPMKTCFYFAYTYQIKLAVIIKSLMHDTKGTSDIRFVNKNLIGCK